jgi:nucleoside-diphosphate-sugar epimerase
MNVQRETTIVITGAGGFIGGQITRELLNAGCRVVALKRKTSNLARCVSFQEKVTWVDLESPEWPRLLASHQPETLIHCAWSGVTAAERNDWKAQFVNLAFFSALLEASADAGVKRLIALGSQAEYGRFDGRIGESQPCRPDTAYGATKLACLALLEGFARDKRLGHVWLRLFSVYGPGEGDQWFIPSLIRQLKAGVAPRLTPCEQRYDYLHVKDLSAGLVAVLDHPSESGVFHLSSNSSVPLQHVVELLQQYTGRKVEPCFGALPYRPNQSMHLEGDSTRFYQGFGFRPRISLENGLKELVEQY